MIDLHSHILPGIDDGIRKLEDSIAFAKMAAEDGTRVLAATPHIREGRYENSRAVIEERLTELRKALDEHQVELEVIIGAEIYFTGDLVERLGSGDYPSYGDGRRFFLLELPSFFMERQLGEYVFRLRTAGLTPVIAHPERNPHLVSHPEVVENLVRMGALMQLTAMSVTGRFGREARKAAGFMLDAGLAHIVASDAHNLTSRPPQLASAYQHVAERHGEECAEALFVANPQRILDGEEVPAEMPMAVGQAARGSSPGLRGFLSRLLGN